jgi:stage II sporulation protein AA (anti-sigma F factor antagonist)
VSNAKEDLSKGQVLFILIMWQKGKDLDMDEFAVIDDCLCIRMPLEVDHHGAASIREGADRLILDDKVKNIVFDFERTEFMDSSGIGIIIGRYRKISCVGGKVYAINTNDRIRKMLSTSGMSSIIEIISAGGNVNG